MTSILAVSSRTFTDYESRGLIVAIDGKYDVRAAVRAFLGYKLRETPRDRLFRAQADRAELENRRRRSELLDASEVDKEWGAIATAMNRALQALPGRLLQRGIIAHGALGAVAEEVAEVLRHLTRQGNVNGSDRA